MPALTAATPSISEDEYLAGEAVSEVKHEFIGGQGYAMTGASDRHGLIANALAFALTPAVRRKQCQLFIADMKLRLEIGDETVFYYPDLLVSCNAKDREKFFRSAPCLIIEILSESTARIDRREKLLAYQTIPSLQSYLLVEQERRHVELYRRATGWQAERYNDGVLPMECLDTSLSLDDIYADVA